jgi:hypothetical protein
MPESVHSAGYESSSGEDDSFFSGEWWIARQPFFLARGYALRPRYCPDWMPS